MKMLIVESSVMVRSRLQALFSSQHRLQVETADSIGQGESKLESFKPQIVLLDVMLPDGSGLNLLETIRNKNRGVCVMMFSHYPLFRSRCLAEGADCFFDKVGEMEHLVETVQHKLEMEARP